MLLELLLGLNILAILLLCYVIYKKKLEIKQPDITVNVPDIVIPDVIIPDIKVEPKINVKVPDITIPDVIIPDVIIPDIVIPKIEIPESIINVDINIPINKENIQISQTTTKEFENKYKLTPIKSVELKNKNAKYKLKPLEKNAKLVSKGV